MIRIIIVQSVLLVFAIFSTIPSSGFANSAISLKTASEKLISEAIVKSESLLPAIIFDRAALHDIQVLSNVLLSPSGRYLLYITTNNERKQLWLHDNQNTTIRQLLDSNLIRKVYWSANSEYIIIKTNSGVASIEISLLNDNQPVRVSKIINLDDNANQYFLKVDQQNPNHFYLSIGKISTHESTPSSDTAERMSLSNQNKNHLQHILYRVDINGNKKELLQSDEVITNFLTPYGGKARFIKRVDGMTISLYQLNDKTENLVYQCQFIDACQLESFDADKNTLYIRGREHGELISLWSLNLNSRESDTEPQLIHRDLENRFDLAGIQVQHQSGIPLLVEYKTDFHRNAPLNNAIEKHLAVINASLKSPILKLSSLSNTKRWLVTDENPTHVQKRYYIYDLKTQKLTRPLAEFARQQLATKLPQHNLQDEHLAMRLPFEYKASDGMKLHGYLTLPKGITISQAPLVVSPHGGPWSRETGDFKASAQFLANRGYLVFEPNFRASTGFGRNYILAANRDFGDGRVQQDIIDGVNYLLAQNIGDKNRLAIYGASFGGFSVLTGLSTTPELFQLGIAAMPSIDLAKTVKYYHEDHNLAIEPISTQQLFSYLAVDINSPSDLADTSSRSPDFHKNKISKPLYIISGARDKRVSNLNIQQFALELDSMNKQVLFFSAPGQGHTFKGRLAREAYLYIVELALARHLGGQMQDTKPSDLQSYITKNTIINTIKRPRLSKKIVH